MAPQVCFVGSAEKSIRAALEPFVVEAGVRMAMGTAETTAATDDRTISTSARASNSDHDRTATTTPRTSGEVRDASPEDPTSPPRSLSPPESSHPPGVRVRLPRPPPLPRDPHPAVWAAAVAAQYLIGEARAVLNWWDN